MVSVCTLDSFQESKIYVSNASGELYKLQRINKIWAFCALYNSNYANCGSYLTSKEVLKAQLEFGVFELMQELADWIKNNLKK